MTNVNENKAPLNDDNTMQWLLDGEGSVYTGMTSRPLHQECWRWVTLQGGGKWLNRLKRWATNRPALLLAPLSKEQEAHLTQQEEDQEALEAELDAVVEKALAAKEEGDPTLLTTLIHELEAEEAAEEAATIAEEEAAVARVDPPQVISVRKAKELGAFPIQVHVTNTRINAFMVEEEVPEPY